MLIHLFFDDRNQERDNKETEDLNGHISPVQLMGMNRNTNMGSWEGRGENEKEGSKLKKKRSIRHGRRMDALT